MFSAIALDLDGTLLRSDGSVSERTARVLDECIRSGVRIVIATARPPRMVPRLLPASLSGLPYICYNGAEVYQAGQRVVAHHIAPETARQIVSHINLISPGSAVSAEIDDWTYCDRAIASPWPYDVVDLMQFIDKPVAKVLFDCACIEEPALRALRFPRECVFKLTSGGTLGEVMSACASKATGLVALLARWSMSLQDVVAFGDDTPDIEMLHECGMGVAMANAPPEVKSAADRVTLSNDEDGVAAVLEEMLEGQ